MSWKLSCRPICTRLHHGGDSCQICQFATHTQQPLRRGCIARARTSGAWFRTSPQLSFILLIVDAGTPEKLFASK
jgi:hypothetical protein